MAFDPVGLLEIADRLGFPRQTAKQWRLRKVLPEPEGFVGGDPCWNWPTIYRWAESTGRLRETGRL